MGNCTGWIDGFLFWQWSQCCAVHDRDYGLGIVKDIADGFLAICVNGVLPGMGDLMWFGLCVVFGWLSNIFYQNANRQREAS